MTVLRAYLHKVEKTGNLHVRVMQPMALGDEFANDMHKCGSPAHWEFSRMEWDYPLTAACVLAIQRTAEKHRIEMYWAPDLQAFADEQKKIDDYEQQIRMSIENIIRRNEPLPGYVTNTYNGEKTPMRHQMIAYHWGLRFTGLMLAWDPGTGKTRAAVDLSRGWYDMGSVRPMQQVWVPTANRWGVRGGILVVTKASIVRTWAKEYMLWQNMTAMEIAGEKESKMRRAALPAHAHVINYESLQYVVHNQYDSLVVDECFPPNALIATSSGQHRIDSIVIGDMVLAFDHSINKVVERKVTHVFKRPRRTPLCRISTERANITCTSNHPIWTQRGYIPAETVVPGDTLNLLRSHTMQSVRKTSNQESGQARVFSSESMLLPRVSPDHSGTHHVGCQSTVCFCQDEDEKSYEECGDTGKVVCTVKRDETRPAHARWQREDDYCRVDAMRRIEQGSQRMVYEAGTEDGGGEGTSIWSENRFNKPVVEGGCGVEWNIPWSLSTERSGSEEGSILARTRVVSVDIYQPGSTGWTPAGGADDCGEVFNLEVEETHNYFADGFLVHNCHACANNSGQTENVLKLAQHARRKLGLTGTPISNNLESSFNQMLILDGGRALGPCRTRFIDQYFTPSEKGAQGSSTNIPKTGAIEEVSNRMARCTYFLKKEDALDLPLKTHTPIYLEMTTDQDRYYNKLKDDYLVYIQDSQVSVQQAAARMMKLRQICQGFVLDDQGEPRDFSHAKMDALIDMLRGKLYGRKVVIWAVFTHEIDLLCRRLMAEQIGFVRLDGTVTSKKVRDQGLELWNTNTRVSVFIGQIQMGVGITLHANECQVPCYDCLYLGIDYSFINWTQSQDRIHRIGQKYPCSYTYLLTTDGVDRNIYQSLQAKSRTSNAVYKAGKEFYASLVKGDEPNLAAVDTAAA